MSMTSQPGKQRRPRTAGLTKAVLLAGIITSMFFATPLMAAQKPTIPLGLVVKSGDKQNKMTWVASLPKPSGYNIYRAPSKGGSYDKINSDPVKDTKFTDVSYGQPGIYFYRVTAIASDGTESDPTTSVAPMVVDILSSVKASEGTAIQASTDEIEFEVPAGSVEKNISVRIQENTQKTKGPEGSVLISSVFDCTPGGSKFAKSKPAIIRIKYQLPPGFNEDSVKVQYLTDNKWSELDTKVDKAKDIAQAEVLHFTFFAVTATGAKADTKKPVLKNAIADSSKTVTVSFSEPVDVKSALELTNYSVISEPAVRVASSMISGDHSSVVLTTTYQTPRQGFKLKVVGVKDVAGNVIDDNDKTNVATFFGGPAPHGDFAQNSYMCAACHRAHTGVGEGLLIEVDISTLCYSCHDTSGLGSNKRVQGDFAKISQHSLGGNKTCVTCHDPHLSFALNPRLLSVTTAQDTKVQSGNEFCFACHGNSPVENAPLGDHQTLFAGISHDGMLPEPLSGTRIKCVHCHAPHGSDFPFLSRLFEEDLCFSCHRPNGASPESEVSVVAPDIQSQFLGSPANDAANGIYYQHPTTQVSGRHSNVETTGKGFYYSNMEKANRHAECTDCHNPHASTQGVTGAPFLSPQLRGVSGVGVSNGAAGATPAFSFKESLPGLAQVQFEYEICFKCHSSFNKSIPDKAKDKSVEFNPNNSSYHPVEATGRNKTQAIDRSLIDAGLTSGNQIFCSACHKSDTGAGGAHASKNRYILRGAYREKLKGKSSSNDFSQQDFALCFACHKVSPFIDTSKTGRDDTNFRMHGFHLNELFDDGGANLGSSSDDINAKDAGHGNAICKECHSNIHGVAARSRLMSFAPNVNGLRGTGSPSWLSTGEGSGTCNLRCHGKDHQNVTY